MTDRYAALDAAIATGGVEVTFARVLGQRSATLRFGGCSVRTVTTGKSFVVAAATPHGYGKLRKIGATSDPKRALALVSAELRSGTPAALLTIFAIVPPLDTGRSEREPCDAGTVGCSIGRHRSDESCQTY